MSGPDEEERADEHRQEHQRVPQEGPEGAHDVHALERRTPEDEQFDEQAEGEHHDDGEHQPADVVLPGSPGAVGYGPGTGEEVQRPADEFGGEERGQDVVDHLRGEVEDFRAYMSQQVSQDVYEDHAHGGEFHREVPPEADYDGHEHRQGGQDERIRPPEEGAEDHHRDVQRRESVNEPAGTDPFHKLGQITKNAAQKQTAPSVRPEKRAARPPKTGGWFIPVGNCGEKIIFLRCKKPQISDHGNPT